MILWATLQCPSSKSVCFWRLTLYSDILERYREIHLVSLLNHGLLLCAQREVSRELSCWEEGNGGKRELKLERGELVDYRKRRVMLSQKIRVRATARLQSKTSS